ncbi:MAG: hypothetical protein ACSLFO_13840, partial [Acidimicrobiales bacterium]
MNKKNRKSIAAAVLAASVVTGGLAGSMFGGPAAAGAAGAAGTAASAVGWVEDALGGLVDDGTISQEQADAVETALVEARPERGDRLGRHGGLTAIAEALGLSEAELRAEVRDGSSIAEIAEAQGVDIQEVIDILVAAHAEHLAEKVDAGELTQEEADEILAGAD